MVSERHINKDEQHGISHINKDEQHGISHII
jgi:hypothetical protein